VQGSVLVPKLFGLYTRNLPLFLPHEAKIVTYADNSYVLVSNEDGDTEKLKKDTSLCMEAHVKALLDLGMIVNTAKTELMHYGKTSEKISVTCMGNDIFSKQSMKVLGVIFDDKLNWKEQFNKT